MKYKVGDVVCYTAKDSFCWISIVSAIKTTQTDHIPYYEVAVSYDDEPVCEDILWVFTTTHDSYSDKHEYLGNIYESSKINSNIKKCTCSIFDLMTRGCRCGGV